MFVKIANLPKKIRVAKNSNKVDNNSLITFFRKGQKLCQFCITDGTKTTTLPFIEAIKYFECKENEPKKEIPNTYFEYIVRNKDILGTPIETEPLATSKGRSKMEKITRDLKGLLRVPIYTQDERAYIQSVITAFGSRVISESIAKKLSDFWGKSDGDFVKLLAGIKSIVPESYLNQDIQGKKSRHLSKREIVLSEFMFSNKE